MVHRQGFISRWLGLQSDSWIGTSLIAGLIAVAGPGAGWAQSSVTLVATVTHANFHTGGVEVTIAGDDDWDATATLGWRLVGEPSWRAGHPLVRIAQATFVGSLFWLDAGQTYEIEVNLADPDGVNGSPSASALLTTREDLLVEPTLRQLYVAATGSDGNPGTDPALPLRTIQRAADLSLPGDLVHIAPGIYRESVTVPTSGTSQQPIVFRAVGQGAVLDGADEAIAAGVPWQSEGGGLYSRLLGFATGHVVSELGRLYRYGSLADLQVLAAGPPGGIFFDGSRLYVHFADGTSPASHQMHVARFEDGFYLDGISHVRIEGLEIRHFGAGDYGKGVYLRYSSDCAVRLCRIHEVEAAGVWIKGGARHLIERNEIWDTSIFAWPWPLTKGSSAENNAVALTNEIGRGNVIRYNDIGGTFNGIGPCGGSPPPTGTTVETDVYFNSFRQHTDDALEPEGHCSNVRLWGNTIEDVHMAFAVAPASPGPTFLLRNVAYNFGNTRTSQLDGYTASALKINSGYPDPVGPLLLYHNTFYTEAPATEAVALLNPGQSTYIQAANNVLRGTRYVLDKVNPVILEWDWDDLYTSDSGRFVRWQGIRYDTLPELQAGTGVELNGLEAPPDLVSPASGDFRPRMGSPLIDRGLALPGINDGFDGSAPDIGAFEFVAAIFADGFESGDSLLWSLNVP